jgi:hypothetical protein
MSSPPLDLFFDNLLNQLISLFFDNLLNQLIFLFFDNYVSVNEYNYQI